MHVFKSRWFQRFSKKEGLPDAALWSAAERASRGEIDANLGGGVIKQRIARRGQGRSRGYRAIMIFRSGAPAVFVYGFAKSDRASLNDDELEQFRQAAKHLLALTAQQLSDLTLTGDFVEVRSK